MDIAALQAFVAVADHGSFSAAAEALHLTQPAVSKRLANLEGLMRVRLFDRIGRRVLLTEAGRTLYPRARHIIAELEDSRRTLANLAGRVEGRLGLATSHHIGLHRLPPVLRGYRARYPEVRLDLQFMGSENAYEAVADGRAELGVVTLAPAPVPGLEAIPLWRDPLVVVAAADGTLGAGFDPAALGARPAILPGPETFTRQIADRALRSVGVEPRVELSTNYLETIRMMVSVGIGWSVLPERMAGDDLTRIDLPDVEVSRALGMIRHPGRTLSNAARAMQELLARSADRG